MRVLQYLLVLATIGCALLFLSPYLGSEPVHSDEAAAVPKVSKKEKQEAEGERFWDEMTIPSLAFSFIPEEWDYLHRDNRRYVKTTMMEGEKSYRDLALKLKGSAGSFQGPEAKPGLTLHCDYYKRGEPFRGLRKFHLNNGAQDTTYLMEEISGEIARTAGVPASRCSHALVKFQDRDLGLYVFKEAFTKEFLAWFFKSTDGDIYDGGFVHELDANMEKDQGDVTKRDNLKELIGACQEGDPKKRWARLDAILDVDKFISYIAMESILTHWDGYDFNRNNYRLYFDPDTGKAEFFLHGMDQTFNETGQAIARDPASMVGQAVFSNPEWKAKYVPRIREIYEAVLKPIDWPSRIDEVGARVTAALAVKNPQWANDYQAQIRAARQRVSDRIANVGKQLGDIPKPPNFGPDNAMKLTDGWTLENGAGGDAGMDEALQDGKKCLHIVARSQSAGSWRRSMSLQPGKYRFEARVKTAAVKAYDDGKNRGAALRISGGVKGAQFAEGDTPWKTIAYDFESAGSNVILVAELRAEKGDAWFERDSLRLVWMK